MMNLFRSRFFGSAQAAATKVGSSSSSGVAPPVQHFARTQSTGADTIADANSFARSRS